MRVYRYFAELLSVTKSCKRIRLLVTCVVDKPIVVRNIL